MNKSWDLRDFNLDTGRFQSWNKCEHFISRLVGKKADEVKCKKEESTDSTQEEEEELRFKNLGSPKPYYNVFAVKVSKREKKNVRARRRRGGRAKYIVEAIR